MSNATCPIARDKVRRLRAAAVVCVDENGTSRFDGDAGLIEAASKAHSTKGAANWFYETRAGQLNPWPSKFGVDAAERRDPAEAAADRALYLAERFAELNAKAYRDAYTQNGEFIRGVLEAYNGALVALSNRLITVEETLGESQAAMQSALSAKAESETDNLMAKVINTAIDNRAGNNGAKGTNHAKTS